MLLIICFWLLIGAVTSHFAKQRGRDPFAWFTIGILLGLLGLALVFILPALDVEEKGRDASDSKPGEKEDPFLSHINHECLLKDWFYLDAEHKQQGPISFESLRDQWLEKKIKWGTFVWCEGMPEWKKVEELIDLKDCLADEPS